MRSWKEHPMLRGRLHGRLLKILGATAVLAVAAALCQFASVMRGDEDPTLTDWDDPGANAGAEALPDAARSAAGPSPTAASEPPSEADESETEADQTPSADGPDPASEPVGPSCTAALHLDSEWGNNISVSVDVTNTGEKAIDGWEVVLDLDDVEITAVWGMDHIEGDRYANSLFNGDVEPGESVGPSFNGRAKDGFDLPETVPCTVTAT